MTTYTIDRSTWRCGDEGPNQRGKGSTFLLNDVGYMCCLGHVCLQSGVPNKSLRSKLLPDSIAGGAQDKVRGVLVDAYNSNTALAQDAAEINDNATLTTKQREAALRALFAEHGHRVKFVGRAVRPGVKK